MSRTTSLRELASFDPSPPRDLLSATNPCVAFMPMASVIAEDSVARTHLNRLALEVSTGYTYFQSGDVLVAKITPCFENGKISLACIDTEHGFGTTEFHVIRTKPEILDAKYLTYFLRQWWVVAEGRRKMTGSAGQRRVPRHFLESLQIPLPSLPEQRRIAAILDRAEALRAKRRQALAKLDTLTQSLYLRAVAEATTKPFTFRQIANFTTGKLDSNAAVVGGRFPFFTCAKEDAAIDVPAFDCEALLLAGNNAAGEYSVKHFQGKFNAYQRTYVITLDRSLADYQYMRLALSAKLRELKHSSKGTGTKYLTLEILQRVKFDLPPLSVQRKLSAQLTVIDRQRSKHADSRKSIDELLTGLKHKAFRGEL